MHQSLSGDRMPLYAHRVPTRRENHANPKDTFPSSPLGASSTYETRSTTEKAVC